MSSIDIKRINEIIDAEVEFAKKANLPQMVMGMRQIKDLLNKEAEEKSNADHSANLAGSR